MLCALLELCRPEFESWLWLEVSKLGVCWSMEMEGVKHEGLLIGTHEERVLPACGQCWLSAQLCAAAEGVVSWNHSFPIYTAKGGAVCATCLLSHHKPHLTT